MPRVIPPSSTELFKLISDQIVRRKGKVGREYRWRCRGQGCSTVVVASVPDIGKRLVGCHRCASRAHRKRPKSGKYWTLVSGKSFRRRNRVLYQWQCRTCPVVKTGPLERARRRCPACRARDQPVNRLKPGERVGAFVFDGGRARQQLCADGAQVRLWRWRCAGCGTKSWKEWKLVRLTVRRRPRCTECRRRATEKRLQRAGIVPGRRIGVFRLISYKQQEGTWPSGHVRLSTAYHWRCSRCAHPVWLSLAHVRLRRRRPSCGWCMWRYKIFGVWMTLEEIMKLFDCSKYDCIRWCKTSGPTAAAVPVGRRHSKAEIKARRLRAA